MVPVCGRAGARARVLSQLRALGAEAAAQAQRTAATPASRHLPCKKHVEMGGVQVRVHVSSVNSGLTAPKPPRKRSEPPFLVLSCKGLLRS